MLVVVVIWLACSLIIGLCAFAYGSFSSDDKVVIAAAWVMVVLGPVAILISLFMWLGNYGKNDGEHSI